MNPECVTSKTFWRIEIVIQLETVTLKRSSTNHLETFLKVAEGSQHANKARKNEAYGKVGLVDQFIFWYLHDNENIEKD